MSEETERRRQRFIEKTAMPRLLAVLADIEAQYWQGEDRDRAVYGNSMAIETLAHVLSSALTSPEYFWQALRRVRAEHTVFQREAVE